MIGKLTGAFDSVTSDGSVILNVHGVGYMVRVSSSTKDALQNTFVPSITLFIHTAVKEEALDLYGFLTEEELDFFKQLTSVSGIGPKSALGILNVSDVQTLKRSIAQGDTAALTKVFGIGKKSAERVVVELRDKMVYSGKETKRGGADGDVIEALVALGFHVEEARRALKILLQESEAPVETSERISAALKILGTRASV